MEAYPDTVVFGEDVAGEKGGVFKATLGLTDRFGRTAASTLPWPSRRSSVLPIGMAAAGRRPIPEIQFADYIHPAFDQIVSEAARVHYRSNGRWTCSITIRTPFGAGIHGALYHSQSIEAFYAHVPGLKVVVPSTPADVKGLLFAAVDDPDPVLFLEPKKLYRLGKGPYPAGEHMGRATRIGRHPDRGLRCHDPHLRGDGPLRHRGSGHAGRGGHRRRGHRPAVAEAARLADDRSLGQKTSRVLIVHEDNEFVGYGAELAAQIADKAFMWLDAPIKRYALPDVPAMPFAQSLEDMLYPNPEGIASRARELVAF
jgi:2-oxoisovalerate dehydrogenase E1 component beta subunit